MERWQVKDENIFYSLTPQTGINSIKQLAAEYVGALADAINPPLPDVARRASRMVGNGIERAQKLRRGWLKPLTFTLSGELNTESAARWAIRCLGGSNTPTVVTAATSWDIVSLMMPKSAGRFPKMTSIGFLNAGNGYDFLFPAAVAKFGISFEGENDVAFQADMMTPGYFQRIGTLTPGAGVLVPGTVPAAPDHHLMHPAGTKVTFSDGLTRDYGADGDLISGSCSFDNQMKYRPLINDPFYDPTDRRKGAYARDIHHGDRVPMATLKVAMTSDQRQWALAQAGTDITNLTFLFRGEDKIGASPEWYEFEWVYPLCEIEGVDADTDGDDLAVTMRFYPKADPVTGSYVVQRVRTGVATMS